MTTTLKTWINASLDILKGKLDACEEFKEDMDKLTIQAYSLKKEAESFVAFLENKRKFG